MRPIRLDRQMLHAIDGDVVTSSGDKHWRSSLLQIHGGIRSGPDPGGHGAAVGVDLERVVSQEFPERLLVVI